MQTETVTYLKENANKLELNGPLIVTQNGKAKYVIQSYEDYEYQKESLALLKLLTLSDQFDEDQALSIEDAFKG
ncbi:MAG: type II toxin-antitoxin system Phd/YefM family antitoxin [Hahellaceae bacterium]|jgi:PHD/YefM family antitoxin component YafN of YafNO toxin-antitoxin module|nr:type II toxin-antitoxin system Phd/YefM family antitoxin [Hahellaceae bacterium]